MRRPAPRSPARLVASLVALATIAAACSGGGPTTSPTLLAQTVGTNGTLLVAGSNQMTVYEFDQDVANSGTSACTATDDCISTWPALTVPAGTTPTAGAGLAGEIGTITRADSGALQVTYNGVPLYFFSGDSAIGDSNGIYTHWSAVKP
ncbi:MAG: COG4315 family predicted lipoprotein [Candidatus Limnocylindrales bacterium]